MKKNRNKRLSIYVFYVFNFLDIKEDQAVERFTRNKKAFTDTVKSIPNK